MSDLFSSGVRPAIDQWLLEEAKKERDYGNYWSASSAGYCMRKVVFERLGVPKIETAGDARKQRVFTSGHLFHDWIQGITKEAGLSIAQELELQDESLMIRGHIDDLVLIKGGEDVAVARDGVGDEQYEVLRPDKLILYDYKTVNSRSFMWAKKNGNSMSHYHRMQLGTYMYMLRYCSDNVKYDLKPGQHLDIGISSVSEARILKIEKDTLMMMEQQLIWDESLEMDVKNYWTAINEFWEKKIIPPCSCADHEGGFMANEKYNGYFFDGEPCSLAYYTNWKKEKANETVL